VSWNSRHPETGAPLVGATVPFAPTVAYQLATGDPRPSIEERYSSKEDYLKQVRQAAVELVRNRHIVEEDVERVIDRSSLRWDLFTAKIEVEA